MQIAGTSQITNLYPGSPGQGLRESAPAGGVVGKEKKGVAGEELTSEQQREVQRLQKRDREVRQHERAHQAAGGQYVRGGPSYETERGPDGQSYAVGGEVQIDTSPVSDNPSATIQKMKQVQRAALAPADPSAADRQIASDAAQKEQQARQKLLAEQKAELPSAEGQPDEAGRSEAQSAATRYQAAASHSGSPAAPSLLNQLG